jgi:hypothetical protein
MGHDVYVPCCNYVALTIDIYGAAQYSNEVQATRSAICSRTAGNCLCQCLGALHQIMRIRGESLYPCRSPLVLRPLGRSYTTYKCSGTLTTVTPCLALPIFCNVTPAHVYVLEGSGSYPPSFLLYLTPHALRISLWVEHQLGHTSCTPSRKGGSGSAAQLYTRCFSDEGDSSVDG